MFLLAMKWANAEFGRDVRLDLEAPRPRGCNVNSVKGRGCFLLTYGLRWLEFTCRC